MFIGYKGFILSIHTNTMIGNCSYFKNFVSNCWRTCKKNVFICYLLLPKNMVLFNVVHYKHPHHMDTPPAI